MCSNSCKRCGQSYTDCECPGTEAERRKQNLQKFDEMKRITSKPGWHKPEGGDSAGE